MNIESNPTVHIFFTADDNYAKYLAVSIVSIIVNTGSPVRFYILDAGISEHNKSRIVMSPKAVKNTSPIIPTTGSSFRH